MISARGKIVNHNGRMKCLGDEIGKAWICIWLIDRESGYDSIQ